MSLFTRRRPCILAPAGLIGALLVAFAPIANAAGLPSYAYFSWNPTGSDLFTAHLAGVDGAMLFTTTGDDVIYSRPLTPTAGDFITRFGSDVPSMFFENSAADPTADALAQAAFTPALPTGARLLVVDVDQANAQERIQLSSLGGSLTLLEQIETRSGASSQFPTWNPTTRVLQSVRSNEEEASVFDVSGARSLDLWFTRGVGARGVSGAYFIIAIPVPEPASLTLAALPLATLATLGRRRQRRNNRRGRG